MAKISVVNRKKLLITGDMVPKDYYELSSSLIRFIESHESHLTNLEAPLTSSETKIRKSGPHIKCPNESVDLLNQFRVSIACLANNHIYDFGSDGVTDTISRLKENGIDSIGITGFRDNPNEKTTVKIGVRKVTILNYCEKEFSCRPEGISANGIDLVKAYYDIKQSKEIADYCIVVYHGGNEYLPYPNPEQKKWFHYLIDIGADAVIGHHTHIISGYEVYNGKPVFYSLGNFFFPYMGEPDSWEYGMVVSLEVGDPIKFEINFTRFNQEEKRFYILEGEEKIAWQNKIDLLSKEISNDNYLVHWEKFTEERKDRIKKNLLNLGLLKRVFFKLGCYRFSKKEINHLHQTMNLIRCESHRELLLNSLKEYFS